jgi:zinc transport system substrate-binding protein
VRAVLLLLVVSLSLGRELLVVSIHPFRQIVEDIAGERFKVEVLVPPSADYHAYELKPQQILLVAKARAVLVTGVPVGGWERKLEEMAGDKVYRLVEGGGLGDPHLWMSPRRMIRIADRVLRILEDIEPSGKEVFRINHSRLVEKLTALDEEFSRTLRNCRRPYLPETHPSLRYLASDYGLAHIPLTTGGHHGEVLPGSLADFIRSLRERGVDFFLDTEGEGSGLSRVLEEAGLRRYTLNVRVLGGDYFSAMRRNLEVLKEALGCGR